MLVGWVGRVGRAGAAAAIWTWLIGGRGASRSRVQVELMPRRSAIRLRGPVRVVCPARSIPTRPSYPERVASAIPLSVTGLTLFIACLLAAVLAGLGIVALVRGKRGE